VAKKATSKPPKKAKKTTKKSAGIPAGGAAPDPARRRDAKDVRDALRYRHAKGRELLGEFPVEAGPGGAWPDRPPYVGGGALAARADGENITPQELLSRRKFAFLYTQDDLDRLCSYPSPPSWSVVKSLLRVRDRAEREELEKKAVTKAWSAAELRAELRHRHGTEHGGGRKPAKKPATFAAGLSELADAARRLERLVETVLTDDDALALKRPPRNDEGRLRREQLVAFARKTRAVLRVLRKKLRENGAPLAADREGQGSRPRRG
jgi:hypothetical protein